MGADWSNAVDGLLAACRDLFGVPVVYTPTGMPPVTITAIVDITPEISAISATGIPISTAQSTLSVRLADLPQEPQQGDLVTIAGESFQVIDYQPDGLGGAKLHFNPV
jgi:hypothetical protein